VCISYDFDSDGYIYILRKAVKITKITDFLGKLFTKKREGGTINLETYRETERLFSLQVFAIACTADLIATLVSKAKFDLYSSKEKPERTEMWYQINYRPNKNQTATEFWKEVVYKLLTCGEVLVLRKNQGLLIADNFNKEEFYLKDSVFSEVSRGNYTFDGSYRMSNVMYMRMHNAELDGLMGELYGMYNKLMETANSKYFRSNMEKGILEVSAVAKGSPTFEQDFGKLMNDYFKSYFSDGNKVLPLFEGYKYNAGTAESTKKYSNEITDVKTIFEEVMARTAQAFKVPVNLMRGDVASINDSYNILLSNCIDPICVQISDELTEKCFDVKDVLKGQKIVMKTNNIKHVDIFSAAGALDKMFGSGMVTIDEGRTEIGMHPLKTEFSQTPFITLNYQPAENFFKETTTEGGANNAKANNELQTGVPQGE